MQGVGYGLLVLFLAIGIFRSGVGFRDFRRPEYVLRHFLYFVMAKLAVTYGIDLMMDIFAVCAGIISAAAGSVAAASRARRWRCLGRSSRPLRGWAFLPASPFGW